MIEREITITNKLGLHARAAAKLVQLANGYESEITLCRDGRHASAKSIMAVMMLAAGQGTVLKVSADGADAQSALAAVTQLFADRFGEDE